MKRAAVDLGGTQIRAAIINENQEIETCIKEKTVHADTPKPLVEQICRMVRSLNHVNDPVCGLGIGIPGVVDRSGGLKYIWNLPELDDVNLGELLCLELGLPVYTVNDAKAAALAEALVGAGKGAESVYYLTVSTGIGGGFVFKGKVLEGAAGYAGEVGGILIRKETASEITSLFPGSAETLASGTAITRLGSQACGRTLSHAGEVFDAAAKGEAWAAALVDQMAYDLAMVCVDISYVIDPDIFVFGGGCMTEENPFFDKMCSYYYRIADDGLHQTKFRRAVLPEAGILGAAMYIKGGKCEGNEVLLRL